MHTSAAVLMALVAVAMGHGLDWYIPNATSLPNVNMDGHSNLVVTFDKRGRSLGKSLSMYQGSIGVLYDTKAAAEAAAAKYGCSGTHAMGGKYMAGATHGSCYDLTYYDSCVLGEGSTLLQAPAPANTTVNITRTSGLYYFIDGNSAYCNSGAKVMVNFSGNGSHDHSGASGLGHSLWLMIATVVLMMALR
jgi:hypothetical protein